MEISHPRKQNPDRWAPWHAYLVPIAAVNYLRQILIPPGDSGDAVSIGLFVATSTLVVLVVTAVHRCRRSG